MRYLFLLFIGFMIHPGASGQGCYQTLMGEALELIKKGKEELQNYALARDRLEAIRSCNDIPRNSQHEKLYAEVTDLYIDAITEARDREIAARKLAEVNEEKARRQSILTEANRLALISDIRLQSGQKKESLFMAFLARKMMTDSASIPVRFAFGQAVHSTLRTPVHDTIFKLTDFRWLSKSGKLVLLLDHNRIEIRDPSTDIYQLITFPSDTVRYLGHTPDEEYFMIESADHTIHYYHQSGNLRAQMAGHTEEVTHISFSPDGQWILSCSRDNTARIWNTSGQQQAVIDGHRGNVYFGQFSPDSQMILTRSSDGTVKLSDLAGHTLRDITGHKPYVYATTFAPGGQFVLTAAADGYIKIWDLDGREVGAVPAHRGAVRELIVTPNHKNVISRGVDLALKMWNWQGQLTADLGQHTDQITGLSFDQGVDKMVSASMDGKARIWDLNGNAITTLDVLEGGIRAASFDPDALHILTTGSNGHVTLWDMHRNQLMDIPLEERPSHDATFDPEGKYLYFVRKDILYKSPLPDTAYRSMQEKNPFSVTFQQEMVAKYKVLFFENFK